MKPQITELSGAPLGRLDPFPNLGLPRIASRTLRSAEPAGRSPLRTAQLAEFEVESRTHMPFEPRARGSGEVLALTPRVGGRYRTVAGAEIALAKVIGREGDLWIAIDVNGRPVALRRIELTWHALPKYHLPPSRGDLIVHHEAVSIVASVVGEAQVGGWVVANGAGHRLHVVHARSNRWVSLGTVEVEA